MKVRSPIYLAFALAVTLSVALANANGWSIIQSFAAQTWQRSNPSTQHK